jgi:hypothetical protein
VFVRNESQDVVSAKSFGVSLSTPTAGAGTRYKLKLSETSDITDDLLLSLDLSDEGT